MPDPNGWGPHGAPEMNPNNFGQHGQPNPYAGYGDGYGQQPQHNPYAMPHVGQQVRPDLGGYMQRHTGRAGDPQAFMTKVFGWMAMGLGLTAVAAYFTFTTGLLYVLAPYMMFLMLAELGLVFGLSFFIKKMSPPVAIGAFLLYAVMNGVTLSVILAIYTATSIASTFFVTFLTFGFMFVYGWTTKKDLTSMGNLAFMGLIGIIIAGVVNWFLGSELLSYAISAIGVVVFVGLTAWDAQKLKRIGMNGFANGDAEQKVAILGALVLYLDFINLFLMLLRFLGDRR